MDLQQVISLIIVGVAAFLLIRRKLRPKRSCIDGGSDCGCSAGSGGPPPPGIVFRARKDGFRDTVVR